MATTMTLIAKQTVGSAGAASVTFSNIPQTYTDLQIFCSYRGTYSQVFDQLRMSFNGTNNWTFVGLFGTGSSPGSEGLSGQSSGKVALGVGNTATANTFSNDSLYIPNYTSSNSKSVSSDVVGENNATTAYMGLYANLNATSSAITSITLTTQNSTNFMEFSTFYLYGISNSQTQNSSVPYAYGGDIITTDGTYWYHTFLYSGTFTPVKALTCDYLVIAGGGGGGANYAGGGGAGGYRTTVGTSGGGGSAESTLSLIANTNYTATVGAGGASATNGGNSVFSTITSTGGGSGAGWNGSYYVGANGGSGGGGYGNTAKGNGTTNQGYNGGNGATDNATYGSGGGGGGAGAVGSNGSGSSSNGVGGAGGAGIASTISGSSVTRAGGGGGGWAGGSGSGGAGGSGGGGAGGTSPVAGTANTGSGGGGRAAEAGAGAAGGSGIIIVRYTV